MTENNYIIDNEQVDDEQLKKYSENSFIPDDQQESWEDVEEAVREYDFILQSVDWTAATMADQITRDNINLKPRFQRRQAWGSKDKSRFIESLILGIPIPQIVLAEKLDARGKYIVIDGKQRLLALMQYLRGVKSSKNEDKNVNDFKSFKLNGLIASPSLNGSEFRKLEPKHQRAIENAVLRTIVIRGVTVESDLYDVFLRLNTGSKPLSPQELRQALEPGEFTDFIDDFAQTSESLKRALRLKAPDPRMRDTELVLRYFAFKNDISSYNGRFKPFLDNCTISLNRKWADKRDAIINQAKGLEMAIQTTFDIFGEENSFRKWSGTEFVNKFNRAVFDPMVFYFSEPHIAQAAIVAKTDIVVAFKELCTSNDKFLSAIESSFKDLKPTIDRHQLWGRAINQICNIPVDIPVVKDGVVSIERIA